MNIQEIRDVYVQKDFPAVVLLTEKTVSRHLLRRIGKRGEGKFEPITWDEAYKEIAEKLNHIKETDGPQAVAFSAVTINGSVRGCVVLPILLEL